RNELQLLTTHQQQQQQQQQQEPEQQHQTHQINFIAPAPATGEMVQNDRKQTNKQTTGGGQIVVQEQPASSVKLVEAEAMQWGIELFGQFWGVELGSAPEGKLRHRKMAQMREEWWGGGIN
ncbi:unnamed protein product, partial [Ceratitis capitata]